MIPRCFGPAALVLAFAGSLAAADSGKTSREKASPKDKVSTKDKASSKDKASAKAKGPTQKTARDLQLEKSLLKATLKVQTEHLKALEAVVSWAASNGLEAEAKGLVAKMETLDPEYAGLAKVKAALSKLKPEADAQKLEELRKTFSKKVEEANDNNGKRLFNLAASCMKVGLFTRAYDLVNEVLEADPDHKRARDVLSYAWDPASKTWITKWEADMRKKCFFTEEGWIKKEQKKKWDQGQREYLGKWLSKEEEERIRKRSDANPFSVESEHFEVKTNLGRKQAYEFAMLLEGFYAQFFRFFIGYYDQVAGAKLLFNQAKITRKHQVLLFPSRVEYLTFVKQELGNMKLLVDSGGFYEHGRRESYFYWTDRENTLFTLYHEVTHQLLEETRPGTNVREGMVWAVEGLAGYMETWEEVKGKWKPGQRITHRLIQVKKFLEGGSNLSIPGFIGIDHKEFHGDNRGFNYALGASLCHFLLHGQGEIYRESFIRFVRDYYSGTARGDSLFEYLEVEGVTGESAKVAAIEKQFREHMASLGPAADAEPEKPAEEEEEKEDE